VEPDLGGRGVDRTGERRERADAEAVLNADGEVMVAYGDPALDSARALRFRRADGRLSAVVPHGMLAEREVDLGNFPAMADALGGGSPVLFVRASDGGFAGGELPVEAAP
jgi:hypothetical protein